MNPNDIGNPIREPSVDIFQTVAPVVTATPVMGMPPCCVAPNYWVVRALTPGGSFNPEALLTGIYQDTDATLTCAFPYLEDGSVVDENFTRVWLAIGSEVQELDGPNDEVVVIDSTGDISMVSPGVFELEDLLQDFEGSGILANASIHENDYIVRTTGVDGSSHDFPITDVNPTVVEFGPSPDGDIAPLLGVVRDYEIVLNPAKFRVNTVADFASLRFNTETASILVEGAAPTDGNITYTAQLNGDDGNLVSVEHRDTLGASLGVTVENGYHVVIHFDNAAAPNSDDVVAEVNAHAVASELVNGAESAGTGAIAPFAPQNLSGGSHLVFTSLVPGSQGNLSRVRFVASGSLSAIKSGNDLVIHINEGTTTDAQVAAEIVGNIDLDGWITCIAAGGTGTLDTADLHPDGTTTFGEFVFLAGGFDADTVTLDANLIGNSVVVASIYIEYRTLRRKYTALASMSTTGSEPRLVSASDMETLAAVVGEFSKDNPLGLMMYLAALNFPNGAVYGLGVDTISGAYPDGTDAAWHRAAGFLTGQQPYYMAIGSQRDAVHEIWEAHINYMNGDGHNIPAVLERFLFINKRTPEQAPDTIVASGSVISGYDSNELTVSENLEILGVNTGDVLVIDGYTTGANSSPLQNGSVGFIITNLSGNYTMLFGGADPNPGTGTYPHQATWRIWRPGIPFSLPDDKTLLAQSINAINHQISNRRISSTFPDNVTLLLDGNFEQLPGFYGDAAQIGQCAAQVVSKSKLRQRLFGIVNVQGSNDFFENQQLDIIQGGGTWVRFVPIPGGNVLTRHSLTTDVTSPLTVNPTCAWQVDKFARLVRATVKRTLGSIITPALLDDIAMRIHNIGRHMRDSKELASYKLISVRQGDGTDVDIDQIVIDGEASPLLPNNGIKFYITVTSPV